MNETAEVMEGKSDVPVHFIHRKSRVLPWDTTRISAVWSRLLSTRSKARPYQPTNQPNKRLTTYFVIKAVLKILSIADR